MLMLVDLLLLRIVLLLAHELTLSLLLLHARLTIFLRSVQRRCFVGTECAASQIVKRECRKGARRASGPHYVNSD